ncbi:hypothetical protein [Bradyrhizobium sp. JYMT SZCCT0180]|uniref:hypothetical protein n=1 Tax=Bradyrhizobium sp. JYMT SZCCT0180 TaxID=2807666 RepID=UPI001BA65020|nr:hypothetical protein [Bradyrhizobium sp. JYMT SZCCT0180]MBR1214130.1 hypothetical protein [Bradyrhizobium sp. JYMT SZCCT0180]
MAIYGWPGMILAAWHRNQASGRLQLSDGGGAGRRVETDDGPENPELSDDRARICSPLPRDWALSVLLTNFSLPAGFGGLASKARTWSPPVPSVTSSPVQRRSNELNAFPARFRARREKPSRRKPCF